MRVVQVVGASIASSLQAFKPFKPSRCPTCDLHRDLVSLIATVIVPLSDASARTHPSQQLAKLIRWLRVFEIMVRLIISSRPMLAMMFAVALRFQPVYSSRGAKDLTEDERIHAFWPAFTHFDRDRNARISAAELSHAMNSVDGALENEELEEMIRALGAADLDGDAEIGFEEFADMMVASYANNDL